MSEPLLNVMKIMLLAGLYLFFVRVLWAVYNELREPRIVTTATATNSPRPAEHNTGARSAAFAGADNAPASSGSNAAVLPPSAGVAAPLAPLATVAPPPAILVGQLTVIAPPELAGRTWALGSEVTIGRDPGAGVHLDDSYVSSVHARIFNTKGVFMVEDLASRNGTQLNEHPLPPSQAIQLDPGSLIRIGATVLEFS